MNLNPSPEPTPLSPVLRRRIEKALSAALSPENEDGPGKICGAIPLLRADEDGEGEIWVSDVEALGIEVPTVRADGHLCPKCPDGRLVLRNSKTNGKTFWGCTGYPNCKYSEEDQGQPRDDQPTNNGSDWREHVRSKAQLTTEPPRFLVSGLIPEKALTFFAAPSYNCKTWLSLACGKAISTGKGLWGVFDGPREPVPVIYHVPEMHEALVRQYMDKLGIEDSEMFLVRTMEQGVWTLDNPRMMESSKGRAVFLDTMGYFNPADETSDYKQSLDFALLTYNLLNAGCRALVGLYHPPKYSKDETVWTLENSILGSAGYGGILRSCLRMKNLNPDLNDSNVHVYVEGLKNPGLKPFQLEGIPLRMKVAPGKSAHLKDLVKARGGDPRYIQACELFEKGLSQRDVRDSFSDPKPSLGAVNAWHKRWESETLIPTFEPAPV